MAKTEIVGHFGLIYRYRIKFTFISDNEVLFLDIGAHDIYK
jgi:hypothetical protein